MSAEMAYLSNRAYAFQPIYWQMFTYERIVKDDDGITWRSAEIPLNAFIAGPAAGGPMPSAAPGWDAVAPRAVTLDWFNQVGEVKRTVCMRLFAIDH